MKLGWKEFGVEFRYLEWWRGKKCLLANILQNEGKLNTPRLALLIFFIFVFGSCYWLLFVHFFARLFVIQVHYPFSGPLLSSCHFLINCKSTGRLLVILFRYFSHRSTVGCYLNVLLWIKSWLFFVYLPLAFYRSFLVISSHRYVRWWFTFVAISFTFPRRVCRYSFLVTSPYRTIVSFTTSLLIRYPSLTVFTFLHFT